MAYGHETQTATIKMAERETGRVQQGMCLNAYPQGARDCDDQLVCDKHVSVIEVACAHDQGSKEGASCERDRDGSDVEFVTIEALQQGESETMHMLVSLLDPTNCSGQGDKSYRILPIAVDKGTRVGDRDRKEEEEDEWRNINGVGTGILLLCLALLYFIFR